MNTAGKLAFIVILLLVALAGQTVFIVQETQRAVMLRFGEVVNADISTGLHFKAPLMHTVRKFDGRVLTLDAPSERFLTIEKKPLEVDYYAKWRVADTEKYYTATSGEEARAQGLIQQRVSNGLRDQFGERTVHEVVSGERDQLMSEITSQLGQITLKQFGVELVDVRVKRIDLPERVSESVFDRMRSERQREAREFRSTGNELAEGIRASADREKTVIEASAYRDAEQIRGEGDAKAASAYANAYNKDREFYAFWRSLKAYKESFHDKGDLMLVDPESDFFKYLKDPKAGK